MVGKWNTQKIEQKHSTLRTWIKRLARKTIFFSNTISCSRCNWIVHQSLWIWTGSLTQRSPSLEHHRVRGTFYCSCEFVYSWTDSEISTKESIRFNRTENFGSVWESELRELRSNPSLKIFEGNVLNLWVWIMILQLAKPASRSINRSRTHHPWNSKLSRCQL